KDGIGVTAGDLQVNATGSQVNAVEVKKVNDDGQLRPLIDGKKVVVSKAIIRRDLHLDDVDGVDCLSNNEIFEELARMGYENAKRTAWNEFSCFMASVVIFLATGRKFNLSKYIFDSMVRNVDSLSKFLMYPRFLQVLMDHQVDGMTTHNTRYTSLALTQKVFANIRRIGKGFSGVETPVFASILVQPQPQAEEDVEIPIAPAPPSTTAQRVKSSNDTILGAQEDASKRGEKIAAIDVMRVKYPIIDWEIHTKSSRTYWKIIRVRGITKAYQNFEDMLKGFDREDLVALWNLVKEKFNSAVPSEDKEKALWVELKRLFEPDANDVHWKLQRYRHAPLT
nr:hypothetical protein [Tanacetum cinerariifolium]